MKLRPHNLRQAIRDLEQRIAVIPHVGIRGGTIEIPTLAFRTVSVVVQLAPDKTEDSPFWAQ